jgi:hypothetical protein
MEAIKYFLHERKANVLGEILFSLENKLGNWKILNFLVLTKNFEYSRFSTVSINFHISAQLEHTLSDVNILIYQRISRLRSGDRIPVGARFSAPIQTGPGAHPASYTICTGSLSWG